MNAFKLLMLLTVLSIWRLRADTIVVPVDANPSTSADFVNQADSTTKEYQELIPASEFGSESVILEITQFAWREAGGITSDAQIPSLQIRLSTTEASISSLSPVLDANLGPDQTTVFSGPYLLKASTNPSGGGAFDIPFVFKRPFNYNSSQGNLLIDLVITSGTAQNPFLSGLTFGFLNGANGLGFAKEGGFVGNAGPVTEFTYSVPEPRACSLLATGLILLISFRKK